MFESLEDRTAPAAVPLVGLTVPPQPFLGEQMTFTVRFDNTSATPTDVGYGPYVDLTLPATGADGAGAAVDDGISFGSASFLGQPVAVTVLTFDALGQAIHPFAKDNLGNPIIVAGTPGDQLVVLTLPFGSFTPDQPAVDITVTANVSNLIDVGTPLPISAVGGFRYGQDALDNSLSDPPLRGATASATTTPTLLKLSKSYVGPEDETASGPNFPRQYIITVDIADGQTITNLDLTDLLPNNLQFLSVVSSAIRGTATATTAISTPSTTLPGGTLTRRFASVTGTTAGNDATLTFSYFVPLNNSSGNPVINAVTGDDATSVNDALTQGNWTPIDPRDTPTVVTSNVTTNDHTLTDKSIATQKSVSVVNDTGSAGPTPGDTLQYTVQIQVSDFFAFQNVTLADVISDGQRFDSTFIPTMLVNGNPFTLPVLAMSPSNFTITNHFSALPGDGNPNDATNGTTAVDFNVSAELITRGQNGRLLGGLVSPSGGLVAAPGDGPTTVTLVFRTVIQESFTDAFPAPRNVVNQGDSLTNNVAVNADLLAVSNLAPTGSSEADTSSAGVSIARSTLQKSIYAINGNTALTNPIQVAPGDTVTYRLTYTLNTSDTEGLSFTDYLPLPVFDATTVSTFSNTQNDTAPPAGTAWLLTSDTFNDFFPTITPARVINAAANSVQFVYGTVTDPLDRASTIDIVFTVRASADPFADGLFLTNQARSSEQSSAQIPGNEVFTQDAIVQILLTEPAIPTIRKGVVAASNPAGTFGSTVAPVGITFSAPGSAGTRFSGGTINSGNIGTTLNSNLSNIDAGDLVTFVMVAENTGRSRNGAFDVTFQDTLPAGFVVPAGGLNLRVTDGTGASFTFTDLGGGLLGSGIRLDDPGPTDPAAGALDAGKDSSGNVVTNGRNIAIITYDLQATGAVTPRQNITNTATLTNFAGVEGGPDHTAGGTDRTDTATVTIAPPTVSKGLVGTEIVNASNSNTQAVIGELVTYRLIVTLPEGQTPGAVLVDTLDSGLAFIDLDPANPPVLSSGLSFTGSTAPVVTNNGQTLTFNLGTFTNTDTSNAVPETITLTYRAVVLNVAGNQSGTALNNSVVMSWTGNTLAAVSAPNVTVLEPNPTVTKGVIVNGAGTIGDAGDSVVYTVTIANPSSGSTTAFDLTVSDPIPTQIVSPTITGVTGAVPGDFTIVGGVLQSTGALDLTPGATVVITVSGTLSSQVFTGQSVANTAHIEFTSLDGNIVDRSTFNTNSDERTGTNSPAVNDYFRNGTATLTVLSPNPTKTIVATSEASTGVVTGVERAVVGEIIRYRLATRVAEGVSNDLQFLERLPNGLQFLNDGTARVAFVSNGGTGGIVSTAFGSTPALSGPGLDVTGAAGSVSPTFSLPDFNVSTSATANADVYGSGTDFYFKLGTLTNKDRDPDQEFVVVEFNALVLNEVGNQANTTLNNDYQVRLINPTTSTTLTVGTSPQNTGNRVIVAEPSIVATKTMTSAAPVDGGDTVIYLVTYTNNSNTQFGSNQATAFDLRLTDTLDADLTPVSVSSSDPFTNNNPAFAGNLIDLTVGSLAPGASFSFTITATVIANVNSGATISNTTAGVFSSLPGGTGTAGNPTGSTTPGASGTATGERNGVTNPGTLNDYAASASTATVVLGAPQIDKLNPADVTYVIGEIVSYDILVTLREGVTQNLILTDLLPVGLEYVPTTAAVITSAAGSGGLLTANFNGSNITSPASNNPTGSGTDLVLTFGNITTTADNLSGNNSFLVRLSAKVLDVASNQAGTVLTNNAQLTYTNGATGVTTVVVDPTPNVNITVQEPTLSMTKSLVAIGQDAGDPVVYQITITNATGANVSTAFDIHLLDTLDTNIILNNATLGSGIVVSGASVLVNTSAVNAPPGSPSLVDLVLDQLAPGATVTITINAQVRVGAPIPTSIANMSTGTYTSVGGAVTGERTGAGGVDDYIVSAVAPAVVAGTPPILLKVQPADTTYSIGEIVSYRLVIDLNEGTTSQLIVTDNLPTGMEYVAGSATTITTAAASGGLLSQNYAGGPLSFVANSPSGSGSDLVLNFGNVVTTSDNILNNNRFVIQLQARVLNVAANQAGSTLTNAASLTYFNSVTGSTAVIDAPVPAVVNVVEPSLTMTKTLVTAGSDAGDPVVYQITITNSNEPTSAPAYDFKILDTLDSDLAYVSASASQGILVDSTTGNSVALTLDQLAPGASVTVTIHAVVAANAPAGATVANSFSVTYSSLPGIDPQSGTVTGERIGSGGVNDYTGGGSSPSFTLSQPQIDKLTPADTTYAVGETVGYDILVTLPEGVTQNLVVTDALPSGLIFVGANVQTAAGGPLALPFAGSVDATPTVTSSGNTFRFAFDSSPSTATNDNNSSNNQFVLHITARVANILANQSGTVLTNTALLQYTDGTLPGTTTVNDPTPNVDVTVVEPSLIMTKAIVTQATVAGDPVVYQITVTNASRPNASTAYDINVLDTLDTDLILTNATVGSGIVVAGASVIGNSSAVNSPPGTPSRVNLTLDQLAPGASATITVFAQVRAGAPSNTTITNNATATYTSVAGTVAGERTGSDGTGGLNDSNSR